MSVWVCVCGVCVGMSECECGYVCKTVHMSSYAHVQPLLGSMPLAGCFLWLQVKSKTTTKSSVLLCIHLL